MDGRVRLQTELRLGPVRVVSLDAVADRAYVFGMEDQCEFVSEEGQCMAETPTCQGCSGFSTSAFATLLVVVLAVALGEFFTRGREG